MGSIDDIIGKAAHRSALRRWRRFADKAQSLELDELKSLRGEARKLKRQVDRLCHVADGRLTLPYVGSNAIRKPLGTDWAWRPPLWRGPLTPPGIAAAENRTTFGEGVTLFHDCKVSELTLRQVRNTRGEDLAPYGLRMDVFRFDGSFLSLAIDLPTEGVEGLKKKHLISLGTVVELEKPLEIFARLNLKHGPNVEQTVFELELGADEVMAEFDLAYTELNEKRIERAWIDLIFEGPEMNQVTLRDLTFTRRPRAEI